MSASLVERISVDEQLQSLATLVQQLLIAPINCTIRNSQRRRKTNAASNPDDLHPSDATTRICRSAKKADAHEDSHRSTTQSDRSSLRSRVFPLAPKFEP
jgi:hypothetical protein